MVLLYSKSFYQNYTKELYYLYKNLFIYLFMVNNKSKDPTGVIGKIKNKPKETPPLPSEEHGNT